MHGRDHYPGGADPIRAIYYDYYNGQGDPPLNINLPGFLDVTTDSYTTFVNNGDDGISMFDNGTGGINLAANEQIGITNTGGSSFGILIHQIGGSVGTEITDDSSDGLYLNSSNVMQLLAFGVMTIQDTDGGMRIISTYSPNDFNAQLGSIHSFAIQILAGDSGNIGLSTIAGFDVGGNVGAVRAGQSTFAGGSGLTFKGAHVIIGSGQTFSVVDQGGFRIFEVRNNGSVHIKTATAIIADL